MFLQLGNRRIYYEVKGEGKPILLVHGWGGSSKSLEKLSHLLSNKNRVITIDLPGFGQSDDPEKDWGVEEYGETLIVFLQKLKLSKIIFFGHSFGGSLGIFLASHHPHSIEKLILCSPSYKRGRKSSKFSSYFHFLPALLKKPIYRFFFPDSDLFKVPKLETNFRKIVTQDLTSLLENTSCPTLVLWGEEDSETLFSLALDLHKRIRNSKLTSFKDIGHDLPINYPDLVFEKMRVFI